MYAVHKNEVAFILHAHIRDALLSTHVCSIALSFWFKLLDNSVCVRVHAAHTHLFVGWLDRQHRNTFVVVLNSTHLPQLHFKNQSICYSNL